MAILYRKVQNKIEGTKGYQSWYGRAVILDEISTDQLCEEIAHSTTVTEADVRAVFAELKIKMRDHMISSQRVTLDGIGSFKVGLKTSPTEKKEDFNANCIKGYRIIFQPETTFTPTGVNRKGNRVGFRTKNLLEGASVQEFKEVNEKVAEE